MAVRRTDESVVYQRGFNSNTLQLQHHSAAVPPLSICFCGCWKANWLNQLCPNLFSIADAGGRVFIARRPRLEPVLRLVLEKRTSGFSPLQVSETSGMCSNFEEAERCISRDANDHGDPNAGTPKPGRERERERAVNPCQLLWNVLWKPV